MRCYYFGFWGRLLTNFPHLGVWEVSGNFGAEGGGSVAVACQKLAHGRDRTKVGAARRYFYGPTESRALTRFVAGLEKAARSARIPGLKIETRASRVWVFPQAVKSCPDTNLIPAIPSGKFRALEGGDVFVLPG